MANYIDDFSVSACYESVQFCVERLHDNPFEMLGRFIIRSKQDVLFNSNMIIAAERYIEDHNIKWTDKWEDLENE